MQRVTVVHGGFAKVGGIETFTADLVLALIARKVETELICWSAGGENENPDLRKLADANATICRTEWRWGCRWGWPDLLMAQRHWKRLVDADLLVFGKVLDGSIHRRLSRLSKRMILITPYRPAEMWKRKPDNIVLDSFDTIVVQSASFEEDLRAFGYRGRVAVLPYLPPEVSEPSPWPETSVLQVGFLGRLVPDKNVSYLIRAVSSLRASGTEARLHIYGDGPERNELQQLTKQLRLADRVQFHGSKHRTAIVTAIDCCHMFAFTSTTEGQCLAALEIAARGRPVVATPVGVFPETLRDGLGQIAPLDDAEAYAAVLKATAEAIFSGRIRPGGVQQAYLRRFDRARVIDGYMHVFGCQQGVQQEVRIA